jgi:large subunit ribosomal protein L23
MSLFGNNKTEDKKKDEKKPSVVKSGKTAKPEAKKSMKELYGAGKGSVTPVTEEKSSVTETVVDKSEVKKDSVVGSSAYRVLLRPLLTEKGSHLGVENKYLFEVGYDTNKIEVAKAIEATYGVKPTKVNIIKLAGKVVRRGRSIGRRKNWKKAIVTLPKGKTIQIYEGI